MGFWNWSWRLFSIAGVEVRIHWTLLALGCYYAIQAASLSSWMLLPLLILIPFISILLHEFGHVTAARLVGGHSNQVTLWMFGGLAACQVPASPGRQFFVAAAGPFVNLLIACACLFVIGNGFSFSLPMTLSQGWGQFLLSYTASWNIYNFLFNLLPVYPLDGGRMLRAGLWPVLGKSRAIITSIYIAYVGVGGLLFWGGISGNFMLFIIGIMALVTLLQEHNHVKQGMDPYGDSDLDGAHEFIPEKSIVSRWRESRLKRKELSREKELAAEQEVLDRLLAKVSAHGLPSLTAAERKQLQAISQRQKNRG